MTKLAANKIGVVQGKDIGWAGLETFEAMLGAHNIKVVPEYREFWLNTFFIGYAKEYGPTVWFCPGADYNVQKVMQALIEKHPNVPVLMMCPNSTLAETWTYNAQRWGAKRTLGIAAYWAGDAIHVVKSLEKLRKSQ